MTRLLLVLACMWGFDAHAASTFHPSPAELIQAQFETYYLQCVPDPVDALAERILAVMGTRV